MSGNVYELRYQGTINLTSSVLFKYLNESGLKFTGRNLDELRVTPEQLHLLLLDARKYKSSLPNNVKLSKLKHIEIMLIDEPKTITLKN